MNPKEPSAYFGKALILRTEGDKEGAMTYFQKTVDLDSKNPEYLGAYEDFKKSLTMEDLEKISSGENTDKDIEYAALIAKADKYFNEKKYKEALVPYEKALEINPNNKEALLKIGNIYKNNKDLTKSSEYYQKAIAIDDKYTDAWFNLGLIYANTNKLNNAVDCFDKVISIDNKYTYAYYALGLAYEYQHDNQRAVLNYKKYVLLERDPNLINTVNTKIKQLQKQ